MMWSKGVLGLSSLFSIQFTQWYYANLLMGFRDREEHLEIHDDATGVECLRFHERVSKTQK